MRTLPLKGIRRCAAEAAEGGAFVDGEREGLGAGTKRVVSMVLPGRG